MRGRATASPETGRCCVRVHLISQRPSAARCAYFCVVRYTTAQPKKTVQCVNIQRKPGLKLRAIIVFSFGRVGRELGIIS